MVMATIFRTTKAGKNIHQRMDTLPVPYSCKGRLFKVKRMQYWYMRPYGCTSKLLWSMQYPGPERSVLRDSTYGKFSRISKISIWSRKADR